MKLADLRKRKVAIWGFGVEAKATAEYLTKHNIDFTILAKKSEGVSQYCFELRPVDQELLDQFDVIIKSPGISPYQQLIQESNIKFTSSTAIWFANEKQNKVIAITGTKGKSTTSSMLSHVLNQLKIPNQLVGNIGDPLISVIQNHQYVVLECSSYQTFDGEISADIGLVTNLYPEHLNWHLTVENYYRDKLKLLNGCEIRIGNQNSSKYFTVNGYTSVNFFNNNQGFWVDEKCLKFKQQSILNLDQVQVLGQHNLENMSAVLTVCANLQLDIKECISHLKTFEPLQHRLQKINKIGRFYPINDSISSTPYATIAAIKSLKNLEKTTLLLGGFDRKVPWDDFADFVKGIKLNAILITGENKNDIFNSLEPIEAFKTETVEKVSDLKEAIKKACEITPENGTILLSPGSPSFDAFANYKQRGEFFVEELEKYI